MQLYPTQRGGVTGKSMHLQALDGNLCFLPALLHRRALRQAEGLHRGSVSRRRQQHSDSTVGQTGTPWLVAWGGTAGIAKALTIGKSRTTLQAAS